MRELCDNQSINYQENDIMQRELMDGWLLHAHHDIISKTAG
jgi:hypothetical protein